MHLQQLTLRNFKNYRTAQVAFDKKVNCFVGQNGAGKTNLLDAIYYLCISKSHFHLDQQVMRHGETFFRLDGRMQQNGETASIECKFRPGKRKVLAVDEAPYARLSEHVGRFPVVMVTPYDSSLLLGGSDERRRFLDNTLSQTAKAYLEDCVLYNKLLAQRNSALKKMAETQRFDEALLQVFDEKMAPPGERIHAQRQQLLHDFQPVFQKYYALISGEKEAVSLAYISELGGADFGKMLRQNREKDRLLQRTSQGVHRDDIEFLIGGYPVKKFGSQGQQKSYLLALKLGQYEVLKNARQQFPLLLLDDMFGKLDAQRTANVLRCLHDDAFGQIFLTDTNAQRIDRLFEAMSADVAIFTVDNGTLQLQTQHESTQ